MKHKAWAVMWAVYLSSVVVVINQYKVPPVMAALIDNLQVDMGTAGWLMSLFSLTGILLALPAIILLNRFSPKGSGLLGLACVILGSLTGAFAPSARVLLLSRVIEGTGMALIAVIAPAIVAMWFDPGEVGLPMGIWSTWVPVGSTIAYNLATPVQAAYGWRGVWWCGVFLGVIAFIIHALVVTKPGQDAPRDRGHHPGGTGVHYAPVFKNPDIWLLTITFFSFMFGAVGYSTWAPTFYKDALGVNITTANFYTSLLYLTNIAGALACGWILGRFKKPKPVLVTASILCTILYSLGFSLPSPALIAPYMMARGFIAVFIPTTIFSLAPATIPHPQLSGAVMGILSMGQNLGMLAGPPVVGQVLHYGGSWQAGNYPMLLGMLLSTTATIIFSIRGQVFPAGKRAGLDQ
ncbi:CynX/NimT family MFS transporter [Moorella sulfitireducens (nom. illeg.)]|uniref:MFS transporter n=1 Tax=Neomoorella sulfitireducens TaxID=2972948 RepID=UPI0021AD126C|nr:MFS transporter [Moorella sulfitireducens]